jgi:hydrogenase/urease accessory protein HupE
VTRRRTFAVAAATALALLAPARAPAHEVRPAFLELAERAPGRFDVLWKVPAAGGVPLAGVDLLHEPAAPAAPAATATAPCGCQIRLAAGRRPGTPAIHPSLPPDARVVEPPRRERLPGAEVERWTIATGPHGLDDWEVAVHGLEATMMDVLVRVALADGRVVTRLLRPDAPSFAFAAAAARPAAAGYFGLGVEHILRGVDHLLFVLCLLLLVRGAKAIVETVTAFTVAHSITLGLATLGVVHVPPAPVEAVIALSIVFLATEIVKRRADAPSFTERRPWVVAFTFGLLHGFGFAGALTEVGLPRGEVPLALLAFNLGVEAGQLLFVAAVLLLMALGRRVPVASPALFRPLTAYGIGAVAAYWLIARVVALA